MRDGAQCIAIKQAFRSTLVRTISQTTIDPSSRSVDTLRFTNSPAVLYLHLLMDVSYADAGYGYGVVYTVYYFQVLQI